MFIRPYKTINYDIRVVVFRLANTAKDKYCRDHRGLRPPLRGGELNHHDLANVYSPLSGREPINSLYLPIS